MKQAIQILWVILVELGLPITALIGITLAWAWLSLIVFRWCVELADLAIRSMNA